MRFSLGLTLLLSACSFIDDYDDFHIGLRSVESDASLPERDGGRSSDASTRPPDGSVSSRDAATGAQDGGDTCGPECSTCTSDHDCPEGGACDGAPHCNTVSGRCTKLAPPSCDDGDACTLDTCEPEVGCAHRLIDGDHDGFAPGVCKTGSNFQGGDCDDMEPTAYPGSSEYCDGVDNDCDSKVDEQAVKATCYPDADGDGFPLQQDPVVACVCPAHTLPERADHAWDCWDVLDDLGRLVFPGQTEPSSSGYNARCRDGASPCEVVHSFDFNCDGEETPLLTTGNVTSCGALGGALSCSPSGFSGAPPACGEAGAFVTCTPKGGLLGGCSASTGQRAQPCL
jgi:hypothetical protein